MASRRKRKSAPASSPEFEKFLKHYRYPKGCWQIIECTLQHWVRTFVQTTFLVVLFLGTLLILSLIALQNTTDYSVKSWIFLTTIGIETFLLIPLLCQCIASLVFQSASRGFKRPSSVTAVRDALKRLWPAVWLHALMVLVLMSPLLLLIPIALVSTSPHVRSAATLAIQIVTFFWACYASICYCLVQPLIAFGGERGIGVFARSRKLMLPRFFRTFFIMFVVAIPCVAIFLIAIYLLNEFARSLWMILGLRAVVLQTVIITMILTNILHFTHRKEQERKRDTNRRDGYAQNQYGAYGY